MIKVENKVKIYELGHKKAPTVGDLGQILVKSHWNQDEMVVIEVQGVAPITVSGRDLKVAIDNAMRTNRY